MGYSHSSEHSIRTRVSLCFAVTGVVLLPLGALGSRFGLWDYNVGIIMVVLGFLSALVPLALFLGFGWHAGYRSERTGLAIGMGLAALPLLVAIMLFSGSSDAPIIHDISTDTQRPPQFQAVLALRDAGDNSLEWEEEVASAQREAYPDLASLHTNLAVDAALARATEIATELGWELVDDHQTRPTYIEAVATTRWFGFKDDIVIRVEPDENGTVLDLRSASRVGRGDLGANAKRIRAFIALFNEQ